MSSDSLPRWQWEANNKVKGLFQTHRLLTVAQVNWSWILNLLVFILGAVAAIGGYRSSSAIVTVCGVGAALGALPFVTFIFTHRPRQGQQVDEARLRHLETQLSNLEAQLELGSLGFASAPGVTFASPTKSDFGLVGGEKGEQSLSPKALSTFNLDPYFMRDDLGGKTPLIAGAGAALRAGESQPLEWWFRDEYEYMD
ncbi:hypothetical protein GYMLUDRAFT_951541 [Collybiopsis luxurians FD-317 M1]|nr:hypothetical protein GYMLUDRAFT_951541 [Collybiopsis luxurians FD-317 M1]